MNSSRVSLYGDLSRMRIWKGHLLGIFFLGLGREVETNGMTNGGRLHFWHQHSAFRVPRHQSKLGQELPSA